MTGETSALIRQFDNRSFDITKARVIFDSPSCFIFISVFCRSGEKSVLSNSIVAYSSFKSPAFPTLLNYGIKAVPERYKRFFKLKIVYYRKENRTIKALALIKQNRVKKKRKKKKVNTWLDKDRYSEWKCYLSSIRLVISSNRYYNKKWKWKLWIYQKRRTTKTNDNLWQYQLFLESLRLETKWKINPI